LVLLVRLTYPQSYPGFQSPAAFVVVIEFTFTISSLDEFLFMSFSPNADCLSVVSSSSGSRRSRLPSTLVEFLCQFLCQTSAVAEMGNRLATIEMAENWGLCPFGEGELGPHLTQCVQGQGPSSHLKRPQSPNFQPMFIVAKRLYISGYHLVRR